MQNSDTNCVAACEKEGEGKKDRGISHRGMALDLAGPHQDWIILNTFDK
jgi:hypothetical protein